MTQDIEQMVARTVVPRVGSRWQHWKGGFYTIVAVAAEEATGDIVVVYRSELLGSTWTRPLGNFIGLTKDTSPAQPRFIRVDVRDE